MSNLPAYLRNLESEAIYILREAAVAFERPVLMYSIGKDSAVLLHLARKAFFPGSIPFPLLHIDTGWKFKEMIQFRDQIAKEYKLDLIVHQNVEGMKSDVTPFNHSADVYTKIMKTDALKEALAKFEFDAAIGGARRDEEKSRAKERVFSFRKQNSWDPRNQRPEFWRNYNVLLQKDQTCRVFPLSNWTECDVWNYIALENIPVVSLYYAQERPTIARDGSLFMVDDERFPLLDGEEVVKKRIRFRTLGCYPLTAAMESDASNVDQVIEELYASRYSERQGRLIDHDQSASMEKKKKEGYF